MIESTPIISRIRPVRRVSVNAIKAIVKGERLELRAPPDWRDGREGLIEPTEAPAEKIGLDESEWRDDPASLADWGAWVENIEPLGVTPREGPRVGGVH